MNCKDCIHYDVCCGYEEVEELPYTIVCQKFKDKSKIIELPCKKGDFLYVLTSDSLSGIEQTKCKQIKVKFLQDAVMAVVIAPCVNDDWGNAHWEFDIDDFGKIVFLKKEEAEKALAEMESKK